MEARDQKRRHGSLLTVVGAAVGGFAAGLTPLRDPDIGHHIAAGRWILQHHAIPTTEPFSWSARGHLWPIFQWLPDVGLALVERYWGVTGLVCINALLAMAVAVAMVRAALRWAPNQAAALTATLLSLLLLRPRLVCRPVNMAWVCLAVMQVLLARKPSDTSHRLKALGCNGAWAAIHPFFMMGQGLALHRLGRDLWRGHGKKQVMLWALLFVAVPVGVALAMAPSAWLALQAVAGIAADPYAQKMIVELQPYFLVYGFGGREFLIGGLLLVGLWARILTLGMGLAFYDFVVPAALLAAALLHARMAGEFAIVVTPWCAAGLSYLSTVAKQRGRALYGHMAYAYLIIFFVVSFVSSPIKFGAGRLPRAFPDEVVERLRSLPPRRLYNDMVLGGFLLWQLYEEVPPGMDGRIEVYGTDFFKSPYRSIFEAQAGWQDQLDTLRADAVLLARGRAVALQQALLQSLAWRVDFVGQYCLLFVRRSNTSTDSHSPQQ